MILKLIFSKILKLLLSLERRMNFLSTSIEQKQFPLNETNTLVISGGGIKGLSALGALFYFQEMFSMKITSYAGTSIGAIICCLLAIGYRAIDIHFYLEQSTFYRDIQQFHLNKLLQGNGILPWRLISYHLEKMIRDKISYIPTFRDIKNRFGIHLTLVTFNVTDRRPEYLNVDTHPDLSCLEAIRMSANVPLLFDRFRYRGKEYLDGGMICNYPISFYSQSHHKTIGINLGGDTFITGQETYIEFLLTVLSMPYNYHNTAQTQGKVQDLNIPSTVASFNFNLPLEKRKEMFIVGFNLAKIKFPLLPVPKKKLIRSKSF